MIRVRDILHIQEMIEPNKPGILKILGTVIGNAMTKKVIYTPQLAEPGFVKKT